MAKMSITFDIQAFQVNSTGNHFSINGTQMTLIYRIGADV